MRKDLCFILIIVLLIGSLFIGIFVRGIKTESIAENRKLEDFPSLTVGSFLDASYQKSIESALSDQILFGEESKSLYNNFKNMNLDFSVQVLQYIEATSKSNSNAVDSEQDFEPDTNSAQELALVEPISEADKIPLFIDKDIYTNRQRPSSKLSDLPKVVQKELAPKPTIIVRKPETMTFDLELKPRGNNIVEIVDSGHLFYPKRTVKEGLSLITSKADNYNRTVNNYPDIDFYCYYIESDVDVDFVNGEISHDIVNSLFDLLDPRIQTSALYVNSPSDYQNFFYKTDHHWNVEGQIQGYKDIIALLKGEYEPILDLKIETVTDLMYNGYKSRKSNDYSIKDKFKVLMADMPEYVTYINYEEGTYGNKENYLAGNHPESTGYNYYRDCNGVDYGIVEYDFNQPDKENLLLYVESFSNPINAFIASHYNKTYFVDYRHYQPTFGNSLDFGNFVDEHEIDDVLFMGYYFFYANYMFKVSD